MTFRKKVKISSYIKNGKGHYITGHGASFGTNFNDKHFEQNYFELKTVFEKIAIFCFENFAKISGVGEIRYHTTYIKNGKGHYIIGHGASFGTNFNDTHVEQNDFELKTVFEKFAKKLQKFPVSKKIGTSLLGAVVILF